ncbi:Ohr family peroxiredoxin [Mesorhizobium sp. VNQ89]|uniref:Ohr family peroxiredoxin n=1 Tax=Mesorhizobium quangtriensis TaxID=3157709 RepID=UPI0032B7A0E1
MKIIYRAEAIATGGRTGRASTRDGAATIALVTPAELGGDGGAADYNPEQLFASSYAASFLEALKRVADLSRIELASDASVTAAIGIGKRDNLPGMRLDAELIVSLPDVAPLVAHDLVEQAHTICPYSQMVCNGLDVRLLLAA